MTDRIMSSLNSAVGRWLPEKRLFLRSDNATRFIRIRPLTQLAAIAGVTTLVGWTVVATSILAINSLSSGDFTPQSVQSKATFEERLNELSKERDARTAEAIAAQNRFTVALEQVSQMQSQLLQSEEKRQELEAGLRVVQSDLRDEIIKDAGNTDQTQVAGLDGEGSYPGKDYEVALDILSEELRDTASARLAAQQQADEANLAAEKLRIERDTIIARNDQVLSELEDAVTVSVAPLDNVFRNVGMDPEAVLDTIRENYSGQGGPLSPIAYSTSGNDSVSQEDIKAKKIIISLDKINSYRIAIEKMPLAMPVRSSFRYTSSFGRRWGRMHEGIDMAGAVGTPIYATGDGVVSFAGRQSGYGNLIKVKHELGTETRYAHLSRIRVKQGQRVSQGDVIGDMGNTGRSTGSHLHYEVRVNGRAVDPMRFIKAAENVF